jgi:hypothetical protein
MRAIVRAPVKGFIAQLPRIIKTNIDIIKFFMLTPEKSFICVKINKREKMSRTILACSIKGFCFVLAFLHTDYTD